MTDEVQFFEGQPKFRREEFYEEKPGFGAKLAKLVMRLSGGLIKTENQANWILAGLALIAIIVSLFLFFGGKEEQSGYPEDIKTIQAL